ncbi:MAG: xanthine dehydrogenase family protein molybdopterin-binding subunit [Burkholderiales bacterium]|nr:xanthine dehydrogenase family protein molybdopterin-binding subunit [Burkholderiales bacterium]
MKRREGHAATGRGAPAPGAIGRALARLEDARLLRGQGVYVDDVRSPRALHAVILRSYMAHAVVRAIGTDAALARPGVRAVFTAREVADALGGPVPVIPMRQDVLPRLACFEQPVIATGRVRYVGEPVALVVADTQARAEDALEAIELDLEPLPAVADRAAARRGDVLLFPEAGTNCALTLAGVKGEADAAFGNAPYRRRERFSVHRHTAVPLETRGLLAEWDAGRGRLLVHGAGKVPFHNRRVLAAQLGLPVESVELVECDIGGAFGVRGEYYPEDFLVPFAAHRLGAAVRWVEDRREHLIAANHARDVECELEIACDREGRIVAVRGHAHADVGAYLRTNGVTPSRNLAQVAPGPYRIPHLRLEVSLHLTNKTPVGTYRAPGRFETDYFRERLFDIAAADLGIDRVEFRRRNLVSREEIPYPLPTIEPYGGRAETDSGDYRSTLERCLAEFDWRGRTHLDGAFEGGRYHGIAIGCYIEGGAAGPAESARIVIEPDGAYSVYVGSSAVGQGLETVLAQVAADALGVPLASIRGVFHGSTAGVTDGHGSYGSRSTVMGGSAILAAAAALARRVREAAAERFGCTPEEVEWSGGREARGPRGRSATIAELATRRLEAEARFASAKRTYSYGAHAAHVAVDPETGHVEVIDYVAVEDVGRIVNPATLHGQTVGAIVQGLGGVLLEDLRYDEEAQLLSGTLAEYLLPGAADFARIRAFALEEHRSPHNPLGAKGAGEGGIIPVGGVIANAVAAALRSTGAVPRELPLSPPRLWRLIRDARAAGERAP